MNLLPCGNPPLCYCFIGFIMCSGVNITNFPQFMPNYRNSTVQIDISAYYLKHLPNLSFHQWPKLKVVDLRFNPSITCHRIIHFTKLYPHLIVNHQCSLNNTSGTIGATVIHSTYSVNVTEMRKNNTESSSLDLKRYEWDTGAFLILSEVILMFLVYVSFALYKLTLMIKEWVLENIENSFMSEEEINMQITDPITGPH